MMTEARTGARQPPAKGPREPPGDGRPRNILLWSLQREHSPATPRFWTCGLQTCISSISTVLSPRLRSFVTVALETNAGTLEFPSRGPGVQASRGFWWPRSLCGSALGCGSPSCQPSADALS